jgi:AraC-like DNA-binding protein
MTHCLDWFDRARPWQIHRVTDIPMRSAVTAQIEDLHRLNLTEPDLPGREPIVEAMLEAALLRVAAAGHRASSPRTVDARIERALEHFHCDIAAPNDVDTMARRAGLSRSQFCLLFRRGTGSAPQAYIEERRLDMAAFHLRTTAKSVGEISGLVGFSNPFYFTNRFSRRFGSSPSAYRANRRGAGLHHGFVSENIPTAGQIV